MKKIIALLALGLGVYTNAGAGNITDLTAKCASGDGRGCSDFGWWDVCNRQRR